MRKTKNKINAQTITEVERAISELRRGQIIAVKTKAGSGLLVASPENLHPETYQKLVRLAENGLFLAITANRARIIGGKAKVSTHLSLIKIDKKLSRALLEEIAAARQDMADFGALMQNALSSNDPAIISAINLAKQAELLPALIIAKVRNPEAIAKKNDFLAVTPENIDSYGKSEIVDLSEVSNAPLKLEHAPNARIISFRPALGGKEHHAIIVGKIDKSGVVPVRIHSSCYTGDLLASLRCDCRDQLHDAIKYFARIGGGVVVYLMQEGRGIGLVNKLRTYKMQYEQGFDTVDANKFLGFDEDERPFGLAAEILKKIGVKKISLMTNNPKKISEMERLGIKVYSYIQAPTETHEHVRKYLKTKSRRMQHMIKI